MVVAMMIGAISAHAQFEPGTFSIQPKLGSTVSWLSNMPKIGTGTVELDNFPTVGAIIGAEAEYQLAEKFSLAAGVNYAQQGSGWEDYSLTVGEDKFELKDAKIQIDYLNLPVVANIYLFKGFAVKAGVQFGFLLNAKEKGTMKVVNGKYSATMDLEDNSDDFKDSCSKLDISIPMGISYQVPTVPIVIDMRYNLGVSKVNKESVSGHKDLRNNVVQLTVGYKFAL